MKPIIQASGDTPFQKFDRLFRAVISVPKSAIEKKNTKLKRPKKRRKKNRRFREIFRLPALIYSSICQVYYCPTLNVSENGRCILPRAFQRSIPHRLDLRIGAESVNKGCRGHVRRPHRWLHPYFRTQPGSNHHSPMRRRTWFGSAWHSCRAATPRLSRRVLFPVGLKPEVQVSR